MRARRARVSLRTGGTRRALQAVEVNPICAIPHRDFVGATHHIDVAIYGGLNTVEVGPLGHLACYLQARSRGSLRTLRTLYPLRALFTLLTLQALYTLRPLRARSTGQPLLTALTRFAP